MREACERSQPTIRNLRPNSSILNNRKGQSYQCAMIKPRPGPTAYLITVKPSSSKFNLTVVSSTSICLIQCVISVACLVV